MVPMYTLAMVPIKCMLSLTTGVLDVINLIIFRRIGRPCWGSGPTVAILTKVITYLLGQARNLFSGRSLISVDYKKVDWSSPRNSELKFPQHSLDSGALMKLWL